MEQNKEAVIEKQELSSHCGSVVTNPTSIHEDVCLIPGLSQWVEDPALPNTELWCRSHMWLGSGVAVAVVYARSCSSSNSTPSLDASICHECGPKKTNK